MLQSTAQCERGLILLAKHRNQNIPLLREKTALKKHGSGATEHDVTPLPLERMSDNERWYLHQLWNGNLQEAYRRAQAEHGGTVQAPYFRFRDEC